MFIDGMKMVLYTPQCLSLKDKRAITKSLINKVRNKYNVSISEIDYLDNIKKIGIGIAIVTNNPSLNKESLDKILSFIQDNYDVDIINVMYE